MAKLTNLKTIVGGYKRLFRECISKKWSCWSTC
jgi:hypothetical protein